jgi:hypothetical protein
MKTLSILQEQSNLSGDNMTYKEESRLLKISSGVPSLIFFLKFFYAYERIREQNGQV